MEERMSVCGDDCKYAYDKINVMFEVNERFINL
jgi:hypothetical protein